MDFYKGVIPIIDYHTPEGRDLAHPKGANYGYVERDYAVHPETMFDAPSDLKLIPESEYDARWEEQEARKSSLEHIYLSGPNGGPAFINLDQNGYPDCWAHSTPHAMMLAWLRDGATVHRLNGVAAATMMNQTGGGWCGMSAKFAREQGYPEEGDGPGQWSAQTRRAPSDMAALRANMALHKTLEEWVDLTRGVSDQNLTEAMLATCGFLNIPTPTDYNFWSHSVCRLRTVRIAKGEWGTLILNSWKGWGRYGLGVLRGSQARADGALAIRVVRPSAA